MNDQQNRSATEARPVQAEKPAELFTLQNAPAPHKPATFANDPTRQRKLLDGLDCLPGQRDLF